MEPRDAHIHRLEASGLLESQSFTARRTFQVEELEDEGSHDFIELTDGSVLYLNGQYLYGYEAVEDDAELNLPRRFPCTAFVVRRHRDERHVVDIACDGEVLEPEFTAAPFTTDDYKAGLIPDDGQILAVPYEMLKADRMAASG